MGGRLGEGGGGSGKSVQMTLCVENRIVSLSLESFYEIKETPGKTLKADLLKSVLKYLNSDGVAGRSRHKHLFVIKR